MKTNRRTRLQRGYPQHTLRDVCEFAKIIKENNVGNSVERALLASFLGTTAKSSKFTNIVNSMKHYGVTEGGYRDSHILLTNLGLSMVSPKSRREDKEARIEAAYRPELFRSFYNLQTESEYIDKTFSINLLVRDLSVRPKLAQECFDLVISNGIFVGIIEENGSKLILKLPQNSNLHVDDNRVTSGPDVEVSSSVIAETYSKDSSSSIYLAYDGIEELTTRVRDILGRFDIPYMVMPTASSNGHPVDQEAVRVMSKCNAAIFVVNRQDVSNNLMFQIGAASVLYRNRLVIVMASDLADLSGYSQIKTIRLDSGDTNDKEDHNLSLIQAMSEANLISVRII